MHLCSTWFYGYKMRNIAFTISRSTGAEFLNEKGIGRVDRLLAMRWLAGWLMFDDEDFFIQKLASWGKKWLLRPNGTF